MYWLEARAGASHFNFFKPLPTAISDMFLLLNTASLKEKKNDSYSHPSRFLDFVISVQDNLQQVLSLLHAHMVTTLHGIL